VDAAFRSLLSYHYRIAARNSYHDMSVVQNSASNLRTLSSAYLEIFGDYIHLYRILHHHIYRTDQQKNNMLTLTFAFAH